MLACFNLISLGISKLSSSFLFCRDELLVQSGNVSHSRAEFVLSTTLNLQKVLNILYGIF